MDSPPANISGDPRPFDGGWRLFAFYWLPVILYCLAIFIQSSFPPPHGLLAFPGADKLLHAGGYALLGMLSFRAFHRSNGGRDVLRSVLSAAIFSSCYGFSDELHQYFVAVRDADGLDALADILGSAGGAAVAGWLWAAKNRLFGAEVKKK